MHGAFMTKRAAIGRRPSVLLCHQRLLLSSEYIFAGALGLYILSGLARFIQTKHIALSHSIDQYLYVHPSQYAIIPHRWIYR